MLGALAARAGAVADLQGIVSARPDELLIRLRLALAPPGAADMLVVAGAGLDVLDSLAGEFGGPGVVVRGVALQPGGAIVLAAIGGRPVLGLPADPVGALIGFWLFGTAAIHHLLDACPRPQPRVTAVLAAAVSGAAGREDYLPCTLAEVDGRLHAQPLPDQPSTLADLVRADGLLKLPLGTGALAAGEPVEVYFL